MTITLTREEAQQVLDALINAKGYIFYNVLDDKGNRYDAAAELLRTRLAQPEPEYRDVVIKGDLWRIEFLPDHAASVVLVRANYEAQPERAQCDGGTCGLGGYCDECPKTQPEPEPVVWQSRMRPNWEENGWAQWKNCPKEQADNFWETPRLHDWVYEARALYTAPPKKEWQGLTDEEIRQGNKESWVTMQAWESAVWWAEEKLKDKNT